VESVDSPLIPLINTKKQFVTIRGLYIKIATALNSQKKAVNGSKILFLGVAYKPDINDARESPALEIMDITDHKGGVVSYHDPYIPNVTTNEGRTYTSVDLSAEILAHADVIVLTTNHKDLDLDFIQKHAQLIVDMRNMIKESGGKVVKL
jgi:UDP-N-acetyl-D-glucosamine dehydrogenase